MIAPKAIGWSDSKGILLIKIDVDQAEELSGDLGVKAMPTFFLVKGSVKNVVNQVVGANPASIEKLFDEAVKLKWSQCQKQYNIWLFTSLWNFNLLFTL